MIHVSHVLHLKLNSGNILYSFWLINILANVSPLGYFLLNVFKNYFVLAWTVVCQSPV